MLVGGTLRTVDGCCHKKLAGGAQSLCALPRLQDRVFLPSGELHVHSVILEEQNPSPKWPPSCSWIFWPCKLCQTNFCSSHIPQSQIFCYSSKNWLRHMLVFPLSICRSLALFSQWVLFCERLDWSKSMASSLILFTFTNGSWALSFWVIFFSTGRKTMNKQNHLSHISKVSRVSS